MNKQILLRFFFISLFWVFLLKASINSFLSDVKNTLTEIGPVMSSIMFALAGIVYAIAQLLPYDKKAKLDSTAINLIIGAIVVGVLTLASGNLATIAQRIVNSS
ncbi:MAG: hypothetical protein ACP5HJ_03935 [Candidatus Micrarchaeia archaeon]|jgi:hypothetical protein